jgi:hypothetical protein
MAELERQASCAESPKSNQAIRTDATYRSITSSALASLLPIAEATGIVQANYNTPKISFYSPSGNLIRPEKDSSPESSVSTTSLPKATTPYHNSSKLSSAHKTLSKAARLPLVRPALVPMTTPPTATAPIPVDLRHHHNYQRPELSQINSCESLVNTTTITGCGGIVRTHSFTIRSGTRNSPHKRKKIKSPQGHHRSTRSVVHDLSSDTGYYKSRYIALAAQGCGPPLKSKRPRNTITKRATNTTTNKVFSSTQDTSKTRRCSARAAGASEEKIDKVVLGPLAGHALRICFCQPYDGAGKSSRLGDSYMGQTRSTAHGAYDKEVEQHAEVEEGVARPVKHPSQETMSGRSRTSRLNAVKRGERVVSVGARGGPVDESLWSARMRPPANVARNGVDQLVLDRPGWQG